MCSKNARKLEEILEVKKQLFSIAYLTKYNTLFTTILQQENDLKNFIEEAGRVMFTLSNDDRLSRRSSIISMTNNQSFSVRMNMSQSDFHKLNG